MNPYWNATFSSFLLKLIQRLYSMSGNIDGLASDEMQILSLVFLSISCALLGGFLYLRKMLMIATALSHTILVGVVSAFLLLNFFGLEKSLIYSDPSIVFLGAFISAMITMTLEWAFSSGLFLQKDVSIGLTFNALFALGIVLVSLYAKNAHIGVEIVSGNIDGIVSQDVKMLGVIALVNLLGFAFFYPTLKLSSFDSVLAKCLKIGSFSSNLFLTMMSAVTVISSFRAVGIVLVLAFLVVPYLCARKCTAQLHKIFLLSPLFGISAAILGAALSRHILSVYSIALSTGALVVLLLFLEYAALLSIEQVKKVQEKKAKFL